MTRFALLALAAALPVSGAGSLEQQIRAIDSASGGRMGVAVVHLESEKGVWLNEAERFPMMSVFKLPIALTILHLAESGKLELGRQIPIREQDLRPGASVVATKYPHGGAALTVSELMRLMLEESDNTACDVLLRLAGGAASVQQRLNELGIRDIDVSLSELEMFRNYVGIRSLGEPGSWSPTLFAHLAEGVPAEAQREAARQFSKDRRNTATPAAMAKLLARIERRETLSPATTDLLLGWMAAMVPGTARLKAGIPSGIPVAHRTGTSATTAGWTTATNDVAIVPLPHGRGHLAIVVFLKDSNRSEDQREATIAAVARAAYGWWTGPETGPDALPVH